MSRGCPLAMCSAVTASPWLSRRPKLRNRRDTHGPAGSARRDDRRAPPAQAPLLYPLERGHLVARGAPGIRAPVLRLRIGVPATAVGDPLAHRFTGSAAATARQPVG